MGEIKYLELALDVLNKKENQQKAGIQGNVFRRILSYWGINEDLYVNYEENCNGKTVDCLITINHIKLPIYIFNYSKSKRDDIRYLNEQIKSYESLLKQFMVLNKLPLGIITNGYILVFFELDGVSEIKRIRNIWLSNVIKNSELSDCNFVSDRVFLEQYCFENIETVFEKYLDLELLNNFVSDKILNVSTDLLDWVNMKLNTNYPLDILKDSIYKVFVNKIVLDKIKNNVISKSSDKEELEGVNKIEILNSDIDCLDKLDMIQESPYICNIVDEVVLEFVSWRDLLIQVLNYAISKNKEVYQDFINKCANKIKFNVVQANSNMYSDCLNNTEYRMLDNGDLMISGIGRVRICKYILELLEMLLGDKAFIELIYKDNTVLILKG